MSASDIMGLCWQCGRPLDRADFGRETRCLGCDRPTRVCRNCRYFQRGRPNDCIEPRAEPVTDKTRANFCEFFDPLPPGRHDGSDRGAAATEDARAMLERLFR